MYLRPTVLRDRLQSLTRLQEQLDEDIRDEDARPRPDRRRIQMLKQKRRLVEARLNEVTGLSQSSNDNPAPEAA